MSAKPLLFLVDDHQDIRFLLTEFLNSSFDVESFGDGTSLLAELENRTPKVAIIDIGLPDMSGQQVATEIRKRGHAEVFLVAITGAEATDELLETFDLFVQKPIDFRQISEQIESEFRGGASQQAS